MSVVCPTVLASDPHTFRQQIEKAASLSDRLQIDLTDGEFTQSKTINPVQVWLPEGVMADIHLMFLRPAGQIETLVSLRPHMVIIHAEAEGDLLAIVTHFQKLGILSGVALLKETTVESARELIAVCDHVLVFAGDLGSFGGRADLSVLSKVAEIKAINPDAEIGWDGGANETNIAELAASGVDVINVGSAIQRATNPQDAYATLIAKITS